MPYFTASDVAQHNVQEDLWVSRFGKVLDLTKLAAEYKGENLDAPVTRRRAATPAHRN